MNNITRMALTCTQFHHCNEEWFLRHIYNMTNLQFFIQGLAQQ